MLLRKLDVPFVRLEERLLLTAEPTATIAGPADGTADLGGQFQATITFDNTHASDVGYGPYVDLILPSGIDGDDTPLDQSDDDGISFNGATFLGIPLVSTEIIFDAAGEALHPYAVDNTGSPLTINGTPGDTLVVLQLPFGSFAPDQTPADIVVDLTMSEDADLTQPLDLTVNGGFQFGGDALDNPGADPSIVGSSATTQVEPIVMDFEKIYIGPEDETATGPNYTRFYELQVDIADGQTVDNVVIEDFLPNNIIPIGHQLVTGTPGSVVFSNGTGTATNGNVFTADFGSITGAAGLDAVIRIEYYVPDVDADGNRIIDINSGDDATVTNDGRATGDFVPNDSRDPLTALVDDDLAIDHTLEAASIVVQKSSSLDTDNAAPGLSPGDVIEYTLEIQVSDYFAFENIFLDDVMSDGQRLDLALTGNPTLTLNEAGQAPINLTFTPGAAIGGAVNFSHVVNSPGTGETFMRFDLSKALRDNGHDDQLVGGLAQNPANNLGATTATITYYTVVQDAYTDQFPSGEQQVGQGDRLSNSVDITGDVLNNATLLPTGQTESDDSNEALQIQTGSVSKSIYAINGNTGFGDLDIAAGDDVTFRLQYALPLSSVEDLRLVDFLPLPVFDATLPDQSSAGLTFNDILSNAAPAAGEAHFHTSDSFRALFGATPNVTVDATSNSLTFDYGDHDNDPEQASTIDVLFTVRVADADFADNLQLTNQVTVFEGNTQNEATSDDGIIQFTYEQAELSITKGVIASDHADAVLDSAAGPVNFSSPGSSGYRGDSSFNSTDLAATPVNANISGIDAGDTISFAIVVENTGTLDRGAFDVVIRDTLPTGFAIPGTASGLNLSVTDANGATINHVDVGGGLFDPAGGIELVDPSATQGSLASSEEGAAGANIVIITYDLIAEQSVEPQQVLTNIATVTNYASREGGTDHVPGDDLSDDATATTLAPTIRKDIISTNHAGTSGTDVTIGEEVTYHVTVTLPEGTTEDVVITDLIPVSNPGTLQIISANVFAIDGAITGSPLNVTDPGTGPNGATFNFGDLVNTDTNNATSEEIVIEVVARVGADSGPTADGVTNDGDTLVNTGRLNYTDANDNAQQIEGTASIDVIEPDLNINKVGNPVLVDGSDFVDYTITINHDAASNANAYDIVITDLLADVDLTLVDGTVVLGGSAAGSATITAGNSGEGTVGVTATQIDLGQTLTVSFRAQVAPDVVPGDIIPNTADLSYDTLPTSLGGSEPVDREYGESDTEEVTVVAPGLTKTVLNATDTISETGDGEHTNGVEDLVIGEQITYEIVITVPEGESNLILTDNLPSSNGVLSYVSHTILPYGSNITAGAPTVQINDAALSDGHDDQIIFDFGSVTNTPDGTSNASDLITVQITALVENVAANQDGDLLTNNARLDYDNGFVTASADVEIVEPELQIDKAISSPTADAGDILTYTLTIDHTGASTATAFDVAITDLLADPNLQLVGGSVNVTGIASAFTINPQAPDGFIVNIDQVDQGETLVITYDALVLDSAVFGAEGDNTASVNWDSNPSDDPSDPSRSPTTPPEDSETVVYATPTFVKSVLTGSTTIAETGSAENDAGLVDLVIGEEVTFALTITLPEGTSDITLTDNLPPGLTYVSSVIDTMNAQVTSSNGFVQGSNAPTSFGPNQVVYDFGTIVNTGSPNDGTQQIIVHVTAVANEHVGNVNDADLVNAARMTYTSEDPSGAPITVNLDDDATVEIVEPELQIDKAISSPTADAGDILTYTLTIDHTGASTATAFDVAITDLLADPNLQLVGGSVNVTGIASAFTINPQAPDGFIVNIDQVDQGETLVITYDALVLDSAVFGAEGDNTASVNWDSNPSDDPSDPSRSPTTPPEDSETVVYATPTFVKSVLTGSTTIAETGSAENDAGLVDLVIGEEVTFALTITVPEGTSDITLTDNLPPGLTYVSSVIDTMNAQVTSSNGFVQGSNAPTSFGPNQVVYDFGTIVNTGSPNDGTQQIIVHVTAVANEHVGNVNDADLVNAARMTYTSEDPSGAPITVNLDDDATVEIVEPELQIDKAISSPTADAGDILTYTLTIDHTGASTATAFDVAITDLLADPNLQLVGGSVNVTGIASAFTINPQAPDGFIVNIDQVDQGETLVITYDALVLDSAVFGAEGDNTASVNWDSNPSDDPSDPSRSPTTPPEDSETVVYATPTFVKSVLTGSTTIAETGSAENDAGLVDLVIGEEVTFALTITVPEGTSDITLTDNLPPGLTYVSSVIDTMNAQVTSSNGFVQGSNAPTSFGPNQVVYDFGTIVNTGSPNDGTQQIIVHVTAVANEHVGNVNDADLVNAARMTYTSEDPSGAPITVNLDDDATVEIVEPELQIDKAISSPTADAGDILTYTLTIDHTGASTATAFDVAITDLLADPNLQLVGGSVNVTGIASAFTINPQAPDGFIVNIDQVDQGETLVITYDALVLDSAVFGAEGDNTASVNWDSNPSDDPSDPSRSPTTPPEDSETVVYATPTFVKSVLTGSTTIAETGSAENDAGLVDLVIGEEVTFALTITLPEGTSDITLTDNLPPGLTYVSSVIDTMNAQVTSSNGFVQGSNAPTSFGPNQVVYDFGTIVNTGSPNDGTQQIIVHVTAVANEHVGNVNDADLVNAARMTYTSEDPSGAPITVNLDDDATVEIVEPELQIDKAISSPTADAGDILTYTLTIDHTGASTATAFDVAITDLLADPNLQLVGGSVNVTGIASAFTINPQAPDGFIVNIDQVDQGETLVITYDALVLDSAVFGAEGDNTASVNWDSNPSDDPSDPSRSPTTPPEDSETVVYATPTFVKSVLTGSTTIAETGSAENDAGLVDLVIGEEVTFALTITLPEGTSDITLTDNLPPGLTYVSSVIDTMNAQVTSSNGFVQGSNAPTSFGPNQVVYDFGTIVNTGSPNDGTQQIIVHVTAVANEHVGNVNDADLVNAARMTYTSEDPSGAPITVNLDDDATVEIVEPELQISKTASAEAFEPGETVTYTIVLDHTGASTATAFDIAISDLINDPDLDLVAGSVTVTHSSLGNLTLTPGVVTSGNSGGDTDVALALSSLDQSDIVTITYQATIDPGATRGDNFENSVDVNWDSNPNPGPSSGGTDTSTEQVFAAPSIVKTVLSTNDSDTGSGQFDPSITDVSLGETVIYQLEITLPEMLNENLVITDSTPDVPGVLNLISGRVVSIGAGMTGSSIAAGSVIAATDTDADPYGDQITFNFGDITNPFDGSLGADDVIVIEITAEVPIEGSNIADVDIVNNASLTVDLDGRTFSDNDNAVVEVVEPVLTIDKAANVVSADAGDIVTYTLTIDHDPTSSAVARDVVIIDLLGGTTDHLELVGGSVNVSGTAASPSITFPTADGFQIDISQVELNETVTVTYQARLLDTAVLGTSAPNTADLSWDGTTGPDGRTDTDDDGASVNVDAPLSFDKGIVATSLAETGTLAYPVDFDDVSIGETVTYHLTATLAEGTDNVVIEDQLPFTNGILSVVSSRVVSIGSDITTQFLNVGDAGTPSDAQLGDSLQDHVRFDFGTVVNVGDNDSDVGDQIVVEIVALVEDLTPENVRGDVLTNTGTLTTNTGVLTDTADVEIIEPELSIAKSVSATAANAGDTITYTLVVSHDGISNAPAYDLVVEDLLSDPALNLVPASINVSGASGGFSLTGGPGEVRVELPRLLESETATITFDVVIGNNAVIGTDLPNTATLDYDSASGPGGRDGSDQDDEDVHVDPTIIVGSDPIEFNKTIVASSLIETGTGAYPLDYDQLAIGETVTYHLTAALAEGTDTIVIEDQLPFTNGILSVESSRVVSYGANITTQFLNVGDSGVETDQQLGDGFNDNVVFNFGTVVNAGDNVRDANDLIVVEIVARVVDVPENTGGDVLTNNASLTSNTGTLNDTADVEVVEPEVVVTKTAANSALFVTETQTFTLFVENSGNGPAYNVEIEDTLPAGMTLNGIPTVTGGPAVTINPPTGNGFSIDVPLLDQGESLLITYTATIDVTAPGGETLYNNVEVQSESEPNGNGRDYETDDRAGTNILVLSSSFQSSQSYGGFVDDEVFLPLVTLNPFFSGTSEYGAHVTITLRDNTGVVIGTQGVLADSGGNWVANFPLTQFDNEFDRSIVENSLIGNSRLFNDPHSLFDDQQVTMLGGQLEARYVNVGAVLNDNPYTVEIVQNLPTYNAGLDNSFNARVYFTPVTTNEVFSHENSLDINRVFEDRAEFALDTMYEAALSPLGLGGNRFTDEFLSTAGSPTGR